MRKYLMFAMLLAAAYLAVAFTMWELNPGEWGEFGRGVVVGIPAYLAVVWRRFR